jgi:hypothetical protein
MDLFTDPATSSPEPPPAAYVEGQPFTCPRCHGQTSARFYGPCDTCRADLRANQQGEARHVDVAEYVPKMNVTPNAVASKDGD